MYKSIVTRGLAVVVFAGFGQIVRAQDDSGTGRPKREQPKKIIVTEPETNLDEEQKKALKDAQKMMGKAFGYHDTIPAEAIEQFQKAIWTVMNGTHQPERTRTNKFASFLVSVLTSEKMAVHDAGTLTEKTAEILSSPHESIPQSEIDNFVVAARSILSGSQLAPDQQKSTEEMLLSMFSTAKYNEEKVKQREADKRRAEEAKAKAEKEKEDRKAKQGQGKGARGQRGGAGNRGGRGAGS